jgi:hypothetical protein
MKKTFALRPEGKNVDRVLDAVKNELRKYVKRERRRDLPADAHFWDFDCKLGLDQAGAEVVHLSALIAQLDALAKTGAEQAYVEVLAKPAVRQRWADNSEGGSKPSNETAEDFDDEEEA